MLTTISTPPSSASRGVGGGGGGGGGAGAGGSTGAWATGAATGAATATGTAATGAATGSRGGGALLARRIRPIPEASIPTNLSIAHLPPAHPPSKRFGRGGGPVVNGRFRGLCRHATPVSRSVPKRRG